MLSYSKKEMLLACKRMDFGLLRRMGNSASRFDVKWYAWTELMTLILLPYRDKFGPQNEQKTWSLYFPYWGLSWSSWRYPFIVAF